MWRTAKVVVSVLLSMSTMGCAICSSDLDKEYSAFGGAWERHDRTSGRVGSLFAPAGERVAFGDSKTLDQGPTDAPPEEPEEGMEGPPETEPGVETEGAESTER